MRALSFCFLNIYSYIIYMKTISKAYSEGQQSHNYLEVLTEGDLKLRIRIKRDAFAIQSYAHIEAWSPIELKWNNVHSIPEDKMKMRTSYVAQASEASFKLDRDELVRVAKAILK